MSSDYVLDASALVLALVGRTDAADALRLRLRLRLPNMRRHAPHLVDAEVGDVLRRHERSGLIGAAEARSALRAGVALIDRRYPHTGSLAELAWTFRTGIAFHDALYVALAVRLGVPLVTADAKPARAAAANCPVDVV